MAAVQREESGNVSSVPARLDTIPKLLLRNAQQHGTRPAFREKEFGIWQTWTWKEAHDEIRLFSLGLKMLGLQRGDTLAIIGDNRPHLYWAFAAAQCLGAIPVPVYQDWVAEEMAYVLSHAEVKFAVAENQEQVDKIISLKDQVPSLAVVLYDDVRGLKSYDPANLHSIVSVQALGRDALKRDPNAGAEWLAEIERGKGSDVSVILYTSGTTGKPARVAKALSRPGRLRLAGAGPAGACGAPGHLPSGATPLRQKRRLSRGDRPVAPTRKQPPTRWEKPPPCPSL